MNLTPKANKMITIQTISTSASSLPNRGEDGMAKTIVKSGVTCSRVSSQNKKYWTKQMMKIASLRTSHMEDFIEEILKKKLADGEITEEGFEYYGRVLSKMFDSKWEYRASTGKKDEERGKTMTVTNRAEVKAVIEAVLGVQIEIPKIEPETEEAGEEDNEQTDKKGKSKEEKKDPVYTKLYDAARAALDHVRISLDKAMFGTMVAAKEAVLENVSGAVYVGDVVSIDEYIPEDEFIAATFQADPEFSDESDPIFGSFSKFSGGLKQGAQTLANSMKYSNTMYSSTCVNLNLLRDNLSKSVTGELLEDLYIRENIKDYAGEYAVSFANSVSGSGQGMGWNAPLPSIVYVESIENGFPNQIPAFNENIFRRLPDKSITEQAIEKVLAFARSKQREDKNVTIKKYVLLSEDYMKQYAEAFKAIGVTVLKSNGELREAVGKESERLLFE